jgi:uncharacterized protein (UPF0264 family)
VTGFLASVRSAREATLAVARGANIIDAKEPASGALGAVDAATLRAIVDEVAGRCPVSATIGDLALEPDAVRRAVEATRSCGADIVKIGLFPGELEPTLAALAQLARRGLRLVAVAFADRAPDLPALIAACAECGFYGVMLDTAEKQGGRLTAHLAPAELAGFVQDARRHGLVTGLAGSLSIDDVPVLAPLGADYLGFRSALTAKGRAGELDADAVGAVRRAIDAAAQSGCPARSSATATAGAMSAAVPARAESAVSTISSKDR